MSDLKMLPNVGKATERDLIAMGYTTVESLKGKSADELYAEECALRGFALDRCQLYLFRALEYYINTSNADMNKVKWWLWKDKYYNLAPCGSRCVECDYFPVNCSSCRTIKGRVFWLNYTGGNICDRYNCCVNENKFENCGQCSKLPCSYFELKDPNLTDEQNQTNLKILVERLKHT